MSNTTHTSAAASEGALELRDSAGDGVSFPLVGSRRSTTPTGREILADAAGVADATLQQRILGCGEWRGEYPSFLRELTVASAASAETALDIAGMGLTSMRSRLVVVRGDREPSLDDALAELEPEREIGIGAIHGVEPAVTELTVPYRGGDLHGRALIEQLERWVDAGSVEPSFAEAVREVAENPQWLALAGRKVALIGAGAEIGPLQPLCSWGAEVLALDIKSPRIWERITAVARRGAGTVHVPVDEDGSQGVDVVRALPETRAWLTRTAGGDDLVLGMYAYADGGEHLCVSGAFDALATDLLSHEPSSALAFLATPTDAFVVPQEAVDSANAAYSARRARKVMQAPAKLLSRGRLFRAAYEDGVPVADAVVKQQGPNYALAKRCQRWRGVAAESAGRQVSFNVAPATWTRSVTKNRALAAAYAGAGRFGIEIFAPETTRVLMAAMLVRDLHHRPPSRSHPERLFSDGAAHGGLWCAAYEPPSVLGIAALAGMPSMLLGHTRRSESHLARQAPTNDAPG